MFFYHVDGVAYMIPIEHAIVEQREGGSCGVWLPKRKERIIVPLSFDELRLQAEKFYGRPVCYSDGRLTSAVEPTVTAGNKVPFIKAEFGD